MNYWLANSKKNLLPLSKAAEFTDALREWFFTGDVDDYEVEEADIHCELCEHKDLAHHFHIRKLKMGTGYEAGLTQPAGDLLRRAMQGQACADMMPGRGVQVGAELAASQASAAAGGAVIPLTKVGDVVLDAERLGAGELAADGAAMAAEVASDAGTRHAVAVQDLDVQRNKPAWDKEHGAWEVPQAWFERTIRLAFSRYQACYVIQLYREKEVCAPACWNAVGADCECSCMGANHSSGQPSGRWYEVSETFAVMWGVQRYSVRLLKVPGAA